MELFDNPNTRKPKHVDLTSEQYFREHLAYVDTNSKHGLPYRAYRSINSNCPFCQSSRDSHKRPFGIWRSGGSVRLGCQNPNCSFGMYNGNGKGNNIFDFIIHCGEAADFGGALEAWRKYLGIDWHESTEKYKNHIVNENDFQDVEHGLFFAILNGRYKHRFSGRTAKFKRLLHNQCELTLQEIENEIWCRAKKEYLRRKKEWNATYLGDVIHTQLRSFYREQLQVMKHQPKPLSRLGPEERDCASEVAEAAAYAEWCERANSNGFDEATAKQALELAKEHFTEVEVRIVRGECSLRQAQQETAMPFTTIKYRKDRKIESIRKQLGIQVRKPKKVRRNGETVMQKNDEVSNVISTKIFTAKDYSQEELRKLIPS